MSSVLVRHIVLSLKCSLSSSRCLSLQPRYLNLTRHTWSSPRHPESSPGNKTNHTDHINPSHYKEQPHKVYHKPPHTFFSFTLLFLHILAFSFFSLCFLFTHSSFSSTPLFLPHTTTSHPPSVRSLRTPYPSYFSAEMQWSASVTANLLAKGRVPALPWQSACSSPNCSFRMVNERVPGKAWRRELW